MKTKITETKFKSAVGVAGQLATRIACLGAVILICSSVSAQNMFVSGTGCGADVSCGHIYEFTWDGVQTVFASGLNTPGDVAFDNAGNLFVGDCENCGTPRADYAIYKIAPNGVRTTFASGLSSPLYLATDNASNLFVSDYTDGIIYKYTPAGSRTTFATGLYHPVGMAFDSAGNLFVADNTNGNIQGSIYEYHPDGSRVTFGALDPSDRPADLAFDRMGNLYMADLGGNIYVYSLGVLRRHPRTTFGSVPNSAQSLAFDTSGNLFVVDAGDVNGNGNAIYKFTTQAVRTPFVLGQTMGETFEYLAFQPPSCCQ